MSTSIYLHHVLHTYINILRVWSQNTNFVLRHAIVYLFTYTYIYDQQEGACFKCGQVMRKLCGACSTLDCAFTLEHEKWNSVQYSISLPPPGVGQFSSNDCTNIWIYVRNGKYRYRIVESHELRTPKDVEQISFLYEV